MAIWIIIILGIVQGACEFLPVSSSGHLVLFYNIFNVTENTIFLSIVLHVATLFAVVFCYFKDIVKLLKKPFCSTNFKLAAATIPTLIIVMILKSAVEKTFSGNFIIVGFLITAVVLIVSQVIESRRNVLSSKYFLSKSGTLKTVASDITSIGLSYSQAICVGIAQGLAIFPGVSRSGSTIAAGLMAGVKRQHAADFSFLLSIPIILAGMVFEVAEVVKGKVTINISWFKLGVGFLFSFVVGYFSIKVMLNFVKKQKLIWFSLYLFVLAGFLILNMYVFKLF